MSLWDEVLDPSFVGVTKCSGVTKCGAMTKMGNSPNKKPSESIKTFGGLFVWLKR